MAHDEDLAGRVRALLAADPGIAEKRMFGGVVMLCDGHIVVGVRAGGLLVPVDRDEVEELTARPGVEQARMGGRTMHGWLAVASSTVEDDDGLREWVRRGLTNLRSGR